MITDIFTSLVLSLPLIGAYGIFAIGIVMIYRASRMLNLAHGAMAMVPAYVTYAAVQAGLPALLALPVGIVSGAVLGLVVEKVFVARLRADGATAQTVGTVAVLGILIALVARVYGTSSLNAVQVFPQRHIDVGRSSISYGDIGLFMVMLAVAAVLFLLVQRTDLGLMMRGTAESRLAASLMGVNPNLITSLTWAIGGALAGLAGILLASVTTLHPYTLSLQVIPAFIAALIGGLGSLPGALIGAAIVGGTQGLVPVLGPIGELQGAPQLFLAVLAIVVMATRGKKLTGSDDEGAADARAAGANDKVRPVKMRDARSRERADARKVTLRIVALVAFVAFPFMGFVPTSLIGSANLAASYAVVAVSLVLLTGWVGQISLGHAALVGIGSYATGHVAAGFGIPFPLSLPLAALAAGLAAAVLGGVALRVRGLYLAVATLVFSWMASEFLFRQEWFIRHSVIDDRPIGIAGSLPYFDFTERRTFFLVAWAVVGIVVFAAANLRDSKTGRAFFAIRGSEMAAASLGIDVMRYKLIAFAISGAIAGMAGNLIMTDSRVVASDQFTFTVSLFFVAVAVVGGLTSLPGAVASGLLFAGLTELFFRVEWLGAFLELISSVLLAVVLLAYRGGLSSIPGRVQRMVDERLDTVRDMAALAGRVVAPLTRRLRTARPEKPALPAEASSPLNFRAALTKAANSSVNSNGHAEDHEEVDVERLALQAARARVAEVRPVGPRIERIPLIEAEGVTVQFGGLTAVNNASLQVCEGEIVGLIGPNGAGKTTLFNAIAGYNSPTSGTIRLYGQDVTALPVHRRAKVGVARTFQLIQLFNQLSVYENLLVATHVHNPTGVMSHVAVSRRSLEEEKAAVARVDEVMELLDLTHLADRRTGDLPFGVLRMIEVARALVTGFRVVMLDEPASGLDNTETDKLIEVLQFVRGLGVTLLLIEHDVRMVTGVSDYMYVLERGTIIAEGVPEEIQRNPEVVAAYLGEPVEELVH